MLPDTLSFSGEWIKTGPTPDFRFIFGNSVIPAASITALQVGAEVDLYLDQINQ